MRDVKTVHQIAILVIAVNVTKMDAAARVAPKRLVQLYVMAARTAHQDVNHANVPLVEKMDVTVLVAQKRPINQLRPVILDAVRFEEKQNHNTLNKI